MRRTREQWLAHAAVCGYDVGFVEAPCAELVQLELLGYVERNPTTEGGYTQWRITESGQDRYVVSLRSR